MRTLDRGDYIYKLLVKILKLAVFTFEMMAHCPSLMKFIASREEKFSKIQNWRSQVEKQMTFMCPRLTRTTGQKLWTT